MLVGAWSSCRISFSRTSPKADVEFSRELRYRLAKFVLQGIPFVITEISMSASRSGSSMLH